MSTKHLSVGSKAPPLVPGKLRLYSMRFCPFAQRIHLVLDAKKIPYDVVFVNLEKKPEWLVEKNPLSKVPLLEFEDGSTLYESLVIADYLDETYPEPPLYPKDSLSKAKDRLLVERFNAVTSVFYKIFYDSGRTSEYIADLLNGVEIFERELAKRGTVYFGGKNPGFVDLMIWPWLERLDLVEAIGGADVLSPERFPRLLDYINTLKNHEAVRDYYLDGERHAKFLRSRQAGATDYDILNVVDQ